MLRPNNIYSQQLKLQLQRYFEVKRTELKAAIDIARANDVLSEQTANALLQLTFMHATLEPKTLLSKDIDAIVETLVDKEMQVFAAFGSFESDEAKLDSVVNGLLHLYDVTQNKLKKHEEFAAFITSICKQIECRSISDAAAKCENKYSVIVAHNRIWVSFFNKHSLRILRNDAGQLEAFIGCAPTGAYYNKHNTEDFRTDDWHAMSFAYAIADKLLDNPSFNTLYKKWESQCNKLDTLRLQSKSILRAVVSMYDRIIVKKASCGCLFEAEYDTKAGSSAMLERIYNNYKKDEEIGSLKHKLWGRRNYDALVDFLYDCEYTTQSIDDVWLNWAH